MVLWEEGNFLEQIVGYILFESRKLEMVMEQKFTHT